MNDELKEGGKRNTGNVFGAEYKAVKGVNSGSGHSVAQEAYYPKTPKPQNV